MQRVTCLSLTDCRRRPARADIPVCERPQSAPSEPRNSIMANNLHHASSPQQHRRRNVPAKVIQLLWRSYGMDLREHPKSKPSSSELCRLSYWVAFDPLCSSFDQRRELTWSVLQLVQGECRKPSFSHCHALHEGHLLPFHLFGQP